MKECSVCQKELSFDCFYVNRSSYDGKMSKCIECTKSYQLKRREEERKNKPDGWKQKTKDMVAYMEQWKKNNPGYMTKKKKEWWDKNKERLAIKYKVKYAIKTGKLTKLPCVKCGATDVDAHHPDYSQPLSVVWLCKQHHRDLHNGIF
jgi:hypothetical protein